MQGQNKNDSIPTRRTNQQLHPGRNTRVDPNGAIVKDNGRGDHPGHELRDVQFSGKLTSYDSDLNSNNTDGRSDVLTNNSDNISTTPLKSITSGQSTKSPSILSNINLDQTSLNASTAETSLAPSIFTTHYTTVGPTTSSPATTANQASLHNTLNAQDRDSESIVTLASSSRRVRRRSIDTNCSTAGIAPASIMERLSVQPNTANSTYAVSVRTSQAEPSQSSLYDFTDQTSSVRSEAYSSQHDHTSINTSTCQP